jgi:lectin, mannose-binding 1
MTSLLRLCLAFALASMSMGQSYVDDMSFGHKQGISPNSFAIPGWSMLGEGHVPQLLSDKVILTPPYGGNKKGALWTESKNSLKDWQVDFEFRVGATDRGSGSLQLWYARDGSSSVSTNSIYSVGKFDGLALVLDTSNGMQKIRGFLNDGSTDYKSKDNIDGLAFGHCDYAYRNLGRPSSLRLKSTSSGLEVTIDGNPCFSTTDAVLPADYTFGLTAASSDPPDSFEVFKFALSPATPSTPPPNPRQIRPNNPSPPNTGSSPPVADTTNPLSATQYEDLNNRLNLLSKSITNLFNLLSQQASTAQTNHDTLLSRLPNTQLISTLDTRISNLDKLVNTLASDLKSSDHSTQFRKLNEQIQKTHEHVTEHVPQRMREYVIAHTPRIGFILYSFMAFQTCCIGAWVWYKYRKATMPKKYL